MWPFRSPCALPEFNRVAPISCALPLPIPALNQGPFPPPALPGFLSNTGLSATPSRPEAPSRVSGWSSQTTQRGFPCCARFPLVYMPSPLPRHGDWVHSSLSSPVMAAFPVRGIGRPVQRPFRGLLSVHCSLRTAHSLITLKVTHYIRGFSHFVTSMTAPIASGWSDSCRVGFAPTEKRRLSTAHPHSGLAMGLSSLT